MTDMQQFIVMSFGAVVALAGLWLLFLRKEGATNRIKLLGQEFELSTPALIVFLVGSGIFILPFVVTQDLGKSTSIPPTEKQPAPSMPKPEEQPRNSSLTSEEQEPNDHVSKANWIELGKTYRGTLRRGQDLIDYFAFSTTGIDAVYVRVLVRVLSSGGDFGNFGVTATLLEYETERQIGEETAIYGKNLSHAFELVPNRKYFLRLSLFMSLSHHCTYELRLTPEGEG
jgi:hypothetical protein